VPYIFDPRSLWVEEQIIKGKWPRNSWSFRLWQKLERAITENASVCVVVSDPMRDIFLGQARRVEVIYTTVSDTHLAPSNPFDEKPITEALNSLQDLRKSHHLFVCNTRTFNVWNSLDHLLDRYAEICQIVAHPALVIISGTSKDYILQSAGDYGINLDRVLVMSLASNQVPLVLRQCHYGLLVRPKTIQSPIEMSIKFPEYLAAGLPVICDQYIGGAAYVVRQHKVGMLLSTNREENQNALLQLEAGYDEISNRCRQVVETHFSVHVHADKYATLYREAIR
jgi:glycosyltransferase involved in cell wall biosynthesis